MILIVVNTSTRRDELHPAFAHTAVALALHSQLSQMSFPALSVCTLESHKHWEPQEQAQLAERVPALEQSTSSAQNPLWKRFSVRNQQQLETGKPQRDEIVAGRS